MNNVIQLADYRRQQPSIDDQQLLAECTAVARRFGSVDPAKDVMRQFRVARLGDLPQEERADFVAKLRAAR